MMAVVTLGNGGYDKLDYTSVPRPVPGEGEVLLRVLAAGCNNTDVNLRLGWYSKSVQGATSETAQAMDGEHKDDSGWDGKNPFPIIQGCDACCRVVGVGQGVGDGLLGRRCLIRPCQRTKGFGSLDSVWMGSNINGAFAQFVVAPVSEVFPVECAWSDAELGSIPCAYGTAEGMLIKASLTPGDHVLVPGASGGVGSAVVQLSKIRGAKVTAIVGSESKVELVRRIGADEVIVSRHGQGGWEEAMASLRGTVNVVVDNVGGPGFPDLIDCLARSGRYVTSGAISGPIVALDLRTLYLMDLTFLGSTTWEEATMPNLVKYIEAGQLKPVVAATFPLSDIVSAQEQFLTKKHVGKIVLIPDPVPGEA